jgi:hypothetical protein
MSIIKLSRISNKSKTSGPVITGITTFTGTQSARLPSGDNSERVGIESGSLRYNDTAGLLEFYDGETWNFIIPAEESANALGVFGTGFYDSFDYITISTLGDAVTFGSSTESYHAVDAACSSSTRGVFGGGYIPSTSTSNLIEYITISAKGNATDFGDLFVGRSYHSSCSSSTRGVFGGGGFFGGAQNTIDYITIVTTGNALDFGDLFVAKSASASCSSSTRGIFAGGGTPPAPFLTNAIDYITIASQGTSASDFGDLTQARAYLAACSSSTRGVFGAGGDANPVTFVSDRIDYITIATTGNATDFGDVQISREFLSACSSSTRGVFGGGYTLSEVVVNTIDYINIATTGNAQTFGQLTQARGFFSACSNNHGGLL